jgi:long-subunit acyl-CoA synthetase (AMP-forming)
MKDIVLHSGQKYAKKTALGTIVKDNDKSVIQYKNYDQLLQEAHQVGSAIINDDLWNTDENYPHKFVGIFSKNRAEWAVVDVACILFKLVSIPIYDTLGDENITYVLKHVSLKTLFVNDGAIKALQKTQDLASLKTLVSFDPIKADTIKFFE